LTISHIFWRAGVKKLTNSASWVGVNKTITVVSTGWSVLFRHLKTNYDGNNHENNGNRNPRTFLGVVHLQSINIFLSYEFKMTKAVLIKEQLGNIIEIDLDIDPRKNEIFKILSGSPTFIGQWPQIDVVIMKAQYAEKINNNTLPHPFNNEEVKGSILLVRMDENSDPRDFDIEEYLAFAKRNKRLPV